MSWLGSILLIICVAFAVIEIIGFFKDRKKRKQKKANNETAIKSAKEVKDNESLS